MMVVGFDSHKDSLAGACVDAAGRPVGYRSFANTAAGHQQALGWVQDLGAGRVAIEGSGGYGRPLALALLGAGIEVVEVPPQMTARARRTQRTRTKSDQTDAVLVARVGARDDDLPSPRLEGPIEDLRNLVFYRRELVAAQNRDINRLHADLVQIRAGYRKKIGGRFTSPKVLARVMRLLSADTTIRATIARRRVNNIRRLGRQIAELDTQISRLVTHTGTTLVDIYGVAGLTAAEILAEVGDPRRYTTKAKFAMANGTAPLEASSGRVVRHRLNRGGNRQLNRVLHSIARTQLSRPGTEGRLFYERLQARGKTKKEAMRILKRRISDRVWTHLQHLSTLSTAPELT